MSAYLSIDQGPFAPAQFQLIDKDTFIIGRDANEADFVIEDPNVSRKHARITKAREGFTIQNLSSDHPTLVNGIPVSDHQILAENDQIQIGDTVFFYHEKEGRPRKKKKPKGGYEDIFGELPTPELPPEPEPVIPSIEEKVSETETPAPPSAEKEMAKTAYDTIFEDVEGESELPYHLASDAPLILKVIGGPNAGAEIGLEKEKTYTIGKDPNTSDIVFQDLSVSRNHARLTVSADGILELEDLGSKNQTIVNNIPITGKTVITSQDTIAVGTTIFMIVDREALQETIFAPSLAPEVAAAAEVGTPLEEAIAKEIPSIDWRERKIPPKHLAYAGAFVFVLFISFIGFFSLFKSSKVEMVVKAPHEHIEDALKKYPGVQYSYNPGSGKLFLAGHVLTSLDYDELRYNIGQIPVISSVEDKVIIDEYVWKNMSDVLQGNAIWRGVIVTSTKPGEFVVQGYVQSLDQLSLLSEYLNVNFPYPDRLHNHVAVEETLNIQIQSLLQSKGFGAVSFQLSAGDLVLLGRYNEKHDKEYHDLLKELNQLGGIQAIKNFAVASLPSHASIDITEQYKVTGSALYDMKGYSAVINGRIFSVGDLLDGMKISSIDSSIIHLEKDGLKYKIEYSR